MRHITCSIKKVAVALICILLAVASPLAAIAESYTAVVMEKTVSVFNDPALTDYTGSLKKGAVVVVNEVNGQTAMITYNGVSGYYVNISALQDVLEIGKPAVVKVDAKAYAKPDTRSKSVSVKKGESPESLQRRVMRQAEWIILPRAVELVSKEIITNRKVSAQNER